MRKILLLPQSAQIKKFTAEEISLMKFSLAECLQGLVTAENLNLDTSEEIFQFITDNPGDLALIDPDKGRTVILKRDSSSSLIEHFNYISDYIRDQVRANILPNSFLFNVILLSIVMSIWAMQDIFSKNTRYCYRTMSQRRAFCPPWICRPFLSKSSLPS